MAPAPSLEAVAPAAFALYMASASLCEALVTFSLAAFISAALELPCSTVRASLSAASTSLFSLPETLSPLSFSIFSTL